MTMNINEITKRPARWKDCVKIAASELSGNQKLILNILSREEKTVFDFPQDRTNMRGRDYVALFDVDRAAWVRADKDGAAMYAFEFPLSVLADGGREGGMITTQNNVACSFPSSTPTCRDPHHGGSDVWTFFDGSFWIQSLGRGKWVRVKRFNATPARVAALYSLLPTEYNKP